MAVLALGISFRRARIDLLERLAFTDDDLVKAYRRAHDLDGVDEAVVLSTCNRVEIYGSVVNYHAGFLALKRLLVETRSIAEEELADGLYAHWERDAVEHLFTVAGGLDSMVLGETQIQSQVREALRVAETQQAAGPPLKGLFHAATRAGRRIRQETSLGAAPDAFVERGASLAEEVLGSLSGRSVVVVGAGTMASLAVKHLRHRGIGPVRILNRSLPHARSLAERTNAEHGDLDALPTALHDADLVVSATGATGVVVRADVVRAARPASTSPLVLLDLAVPRDVEPAAAEVPGVVVIDIDRLAASLRTGPAAADEAAVESIVAAEVEAFLAWLRGADVAPTVAALRTRADDVVTAELRRLAQRRPDLSDEQRADVAHTVHRVVQRLLHSPTVRVRQLAAEPGGDQYTALLRELFDLEVPRSAQAGEVPDLEERS
jgi:glutamyl-tRNA reductase